jgi:hypothetical protein
MFMNPYAITAIAAERLADLRRAAALANLKKSRP